MLIQSDFEVDRQPCAEDDSQALSALNWSEAELSAKVTWSRHRVAVNAPSHVPERAFELLRDFTFFNEACPALYKTRYIGAVRYAEFDLLGFWGGLAHAINDRPASVRIWCDRGTQMVVGDTCERHMLIGQRRWSTEGLDRGLRLSTEAHERPRGLWNRIGARFAGKNIQRDVWSRYLQRTATALLEEHEDGGTPPAIDFQDAPANGNPWRPAHPYPGGCQ